MHPMPRRLAPLLLAPAGLAAHAAPPGKPDRVATGVPHLLSRAA